MKIAPTISGGMRIDPESPDDWHILRSITRDANCAQTDLADRLGRLVTNETMADDWQELIVPDLREAFNDHLHTVYAAIEAAAAFPDEEEHPIYITSDDGMTWFSALNQARLNLEEIHQFGPEPSLESTKSSQVRHEAHLRSRFYSALQGFILLHVLKINS